MLLTVILLWAFGYTSKIGTERIHKEYIENPIIQVEVLEKQRVVDSRDPELMCLAQLGWTESRNEPDKGQLASMETALNRVASRNWPNTICKVAKANDGKSWAYSGFNPKDVNYNKMAKVFANLETNKKTIKQMEKSYLLAAHVTSKYYKRILPQDAWHFHNNKIKIPFWAANNQDQICNVIGNHIYYCGHMLTEKQKLANRKAKESLTTSPNSAI